MQATSNGIRMNYEVAGSDQAPVIVLHHPLATNLTIWDEITPVLTPKYRVVRLDARGHGKTEALVARLSKLIETTPADGFIGWGGAIRTLNVMDRLKAIKLPTQVIVGAEDPATPPAAAEAIHKQIAGSNLIVMPGVSHMLCAEDPPAFHKHVLAFLDKVPAK